MNVIIKKICLQIIILGIFVYFLFGLFLFLFQTNLIYHPNSQNFNECQYLNYLETKEINSTRFYFKNNSKDTVIVFYHGNAGSACDRWPIAQSLENNNYSIIIVEYSGYSNDSLKPSKEKLFQNVENIDSFISTNLSNHSLILISESIGSGLLSYQTSLSNPKKIILISPFDTLENVILEKFPIFPISLLLKEDYNNIKYLKSYNNSVLIYHGTNDTLISYELSQNLFKNIHSEDKELILIKDKGHNDILTFSFIKELVENLN